MSELNALNVSFAAMLVEIHCHTDEADGIAHISRGSDNGMAIGMRQCGVASYSTPSGLGELLRSNTGLTPGAIHIEPIQGSVVCMLTPFQVRRYCYVTPFLNFGNRSIPTIVAIDCCIRSWRDPK